MFVDPNFSLKFKYITVNVDMVDGCFIVSVNNESIFSIVPHNLQISQAKAELS
jgi:hypothetical protein